jgi:hypothetical protein
MEPRQNYINGMCGYDMRHCQYAAIQALHRKVSNFNFLYISILCQPLVYADDINLLGDSITTIKESTETILQASRDVGLEINVEKTKYMIMSCHLNSGQNQNIRIVNE